MSGYVAGYGKHEGSYTTVRVVVGEDWYSIQMDDEQYRDDLQNILDGTIKEGGTYVLPDYTLLKAYYALDRFFEGEWQSKVGGELEQIPYEEGVVY